MRRKSRRKKIVTRRVAVKKYLLAEQPVQNPQQQDCCLIVKVHAPDQIYNQWVQEAAENAIKKEFGKGLTCTGSA
jgi:hypothetical protein